MTLTPAKASRDVLRTLREAGITDPRVQSVTEDGLIRTTVTGRRWHSTAAIAAALRRLPDVERIQDDGGCVHVFRRTTVDVGQHSS